MSDSKKHKRRDYNAERYPSSNLKPKQTISIKFLWVASKRSG